MRRTRFVCVAKFGPPLSRIHGELLFVLFQDVVVVVDALVVNEKKGLVLGIQTDQSNAPDDRF